MQWAELAGPPGCHLTVLYCCCRRIIRSSVDCCYPCEIALIKELSIGTTN